MRLFVVLTVVGLSFVILCQAQAQQPGSIGTLECRSEQLQIQDNVEMEGPFRNHGQLVKSAIHAVISAKKERLITANCAFCIFIEFALGIPVEEQEACGPDLETKLFEPEACYLPDERCEEMPPEDCIEAEGDPQGPGTDCTSVARSLVGTEACCLIGEVCADLTQEDCTATRGIPMGPDTSCSPYYCVVPN